MHRSSAKDLLVNCWVKACASGKGRVSETCASGVCATFCCGLSSDLIKPLPPAQQGLLCSKCFNYGGDWELGCSLQHHVELNRKGILLHPGKVWGPEASLTFKANWNHWGCKSVRAAECTSFAALRMSWLVPRKDNPQCQKTCIILQNYSVCLLLQTIFGDQHCLQIFVYVFL